MAGTARTKIIDALVEVFKQIDGTGNYQSNLFENVFPKLIFWDDVTDYPTVSIVAGGETREYLPGSFKWGFLGVSLKIYVNQENAKEALEKIFYDIETLIDSNIELGYDTGVNTTDINILSISDDQGLLEPLGVGEIELQVRYQII
jgi:hypothetical protein